MIVAREIILVLGKRSTIAPINKPKRIAGKYVVIAINPVIFSELVISNISHINATS